MAIDLQSIGFRGRFVRLCGAGVRSGGARVVLWCAVVAGLAAGPAVGAAGRGGRGQGGPPAAGALIVVGGGGTTDAITGRALALAGGRDAVVAVLPQASALATAGESSVAMWLEAGAKSAVRVSFDDRAAAREAIGQATLIWIPGGDQNRFMAAIAGTGLDDLIRARHRAGVAVGGTSAGAAVLSASMITGDADLQSLTTDTTKLATGLGLWPGVIVDQHFLKRQRANRLISAVLDHPALVGVGIDEATAVIARGDSFEVVGRSAVVVVDARTATRPAAVDGQPVAGTGLTLSVLRAGMTYSLR